MGWKDRFLFPAIGPLLKAGLWLISRTRLPQASGTLRLKGLQAPVEVLRDRWGVPHIYAQDARDVLFAPPLPACVTWTPARWWGHPIASSPT